MQVEPPDLYALANGHFQAALELFRRHGLEADPGLELRRWDGTLCYYDLKDRQIYISVPDFNEPVGKLQALYLRSLFACSSNEELYAFFHLMLPYVLAHETAHHLRHRYGKFGTDLWKEEQIANRLALAVVKPRLSPADRRFAQRIMPVVIQKLESTFDAKDLATDTYFTMLGGLQASGGVSAEMAANIEVLGRLTETSGDEILAAASGLSDALRARLDRRAGVIDTINADYVSNYSLYVYYQLGWFYLGLNSRQTEYVEGFARTYLGWSPELLPKVEEAPPTEAAIRACYQAARDAQQVSGAGHDYFYKRYRSCLLTRLRDARLSLAHAEVSQSIRMLLDGWKESGPDPLDYIAHFLADEEDQALLPGALASAPAHEAVAGHLPMETDRRLYQYLVDRTRDGAAAATMERLTLLGACDILQDLPAETLVELAHSLIRVRLRAGESMMQQGDVSEDVYLLVKGEMAVVGEDPLAPPIASIAAGEVLGEMAFFSGEPRSATVRAVVDSECFVLQGVDLRLLAMARPSVLHHMGGALAKRLAKLNTRLATQGKK